jgi:hypothetical protein
MTGLWRYPHPHPMLQGDILMLGQQPQGEPYAGQEKRLDYRVPPSEFPGVKTPPRYEAEFLRFMNPLLDAMREKGGQVRPREIYDVIAQKLNLSE